MSTTVCNNDCICINCDCIYTHPLSFKERKIVYILYTNLSNPNKKENNPEIRKANCSNGKLCIKESCGYRHRLSFTDRVKLNEQFQKFKIENIKDIKEKPKKEIKELSFNTANLFNMLPDDIDLEVKVNCEKSSPFPFKKGFKEALIEGKKEEIKEIKAIQINEVPINWADNCDSDDDFYMNF